MYTLFQYYLMVSADKVINVDGRDYIESTTAAAFHASKPHFTQGLPRVYKVSKYINGRAYAPIGKLSSAIAITEMPHDVVYEQEVYE